MDPYTSERYTSTESGRRTDQRTVGDLVRLLRDDSMRLLRKEVELARVEMGEKISRIGRNVAYLAIGGVIVFAGVLFVLLAATWLVAIGLMEAGLTLLAVGWLAPLIVGLIVGMIGYAFLQKAISTLKHESAVPERTVESVQETQEWLTDKMN
jgi:hypothetical protein